MMLSCRMLFVDRQALREHTTTSSSTKSLGQALRVSLVKPGAYLSESYASVGCGVYMTFRTLAFPDLTIEGSLPLGAGLSAVLFLQAQWSPWLTLPVACLGGALAGMTTGWVTTRLNIPGLLAGILVSMALYTV